MRRIIYVFTCLIIVACGSDDDGSGGTTNNNIPPSPPSLISPNNNSTIVTQEADELLYFEWTQASDPDNDVVNYQITFDTNSNFTTSHSEMAQGISTYHYLEPNHTYFWKVRAIDSNNNWSNYSQTWSFYVQDGLTPSPPQLVFPLHETECSNDNITFEWGASTDVSNSSIEYKLYISQSSSFDSNVDIYETTNTFYNVGLPQSTALYWKVEAINTIDNSSFSETRSLYTQGDGTNNTIPQIEYYYPEGEATLSDQSPLLQWQGSDNETTASDLSYKVYFSEVGQDLVLVEETTNISSYEVTGLNTGTTYQWSIWVTDTDGATNVGEVFTFTVN